MFLSNKYTSRSCIVMLAFVLIIWSGQANAAPTKAVAAKAVPGRFIVVLNDSAATPMTIAGKMAEKHGIVPVHIYSVVLRGFTANVPASRLLALSLDPEVSFIEPDLYVQAVKGPPPGKGGGDKGGTTPEPAQILPSGIDRIDVDKSLAAAIDGVDERIDADIAIIDTGVSKKHTDLNFYRGVTVQGMGKPGGDDDNGHGSHVAGIAAAIDNGAGVVGVAPGARLWSVKVLDKQGSGAISGVIAGIDWITKYAAEVESANMSLSAVGKSDALRLAIRNSVDAGIFYAVAAGNSNRDVYGDDGVFDTGDDVIPAAYPEVATVSALADSDGAPGGLGDAPSWGADDSLALFSNYSGSVAALNPVISPGGAIDLAAPGVDIFSCSKGSGYDTKSGTSMSAPHLAGAAALYISINGKPSSAVDVALTRQALIDLGFPQAGAEGFTGDKDVNPEPLLNAGDL